MSMQGAVAKKKWEAIVEQTEPIIQGIEEASFTPTDLKRLASAIRSQSEIAGKVFENQIALYDQQVAKLESVIKDKLAANNIPATEANVQKVADKIFAGLVQHDWADVVKKVQKSLVNDKASQEFQKKLDQIKKTTDTLVKVEKDNKSEEKKQNTLDPKKSLLLQKMLKVTVGIPLRLAVNKQIRVEFKNAFKNQLKELKKQLKVFGTKILKISQKVWNVIRHPGEYFKLGLSKLTGLAKRGISKAASYIGFTEQDKRAALGVVKRAKNRVAKFVQPALYDANRFAGSKIQSILQPVLPNAVAELRDNKKRALRARVLSNMREMGLKPQNINSAPHIIRSNWGKDREHLVQTGIAKGIQAEHNVRTAYKGVKDTVTRAYDNSRISEFITVFNEWRKEQDIKQELREKWERAKTTKIGKLVGKSLDKYKKLYKESKEQIEEVGAANFFKSMLDKMGGWKYILGGGLAIAVGKALWDAFDVGEFFKKVGSSIWKWFVDLLPESVKKLFGIKNADTEPETKDYVQPNYSKGSGRTRTMAERGITQDKSYWDKIVGSDEKFKHLPDPRTTDYNSLTFREKTQLSRGDPEVRHKITQIAQEQAKQRQAKFKTQKEADKKNLSEADYNKKYNSRMNTASTFDFGTDAVEQSKPKQANTKSVMPDSVNTTDLSKPVSKREQAKGASNKQKSGTGAGNVFNLSTVPLYGKHDNDGLAVINTFSY